MKRFRTFFGTVLPFLLVATGVFLYLDPEQSGDRLSQWKQDVLSWLFPATDFSEPAELAEPQSNVNASTADMANAPLPVEPAPSAPVTPVPLRPAPAASQQTAPVQPSMPSVRGRVEPRTEGRREGPRDLTSVLGLDRTFEQNPPAQLAGIPQAAAPQLVVPPQPERYVPQPIYPAVPQPQERPNAEIRVGSVPDFVSAESGDPTSVWAMPEQFGEPAGGWLLNRARQAFWEQDYRAAVEAYRQLITEQTASGDSAGIDPGVWGELGNVYYALRDTSRAAQAYARAEQAFRAAGNQEEAQRLLEVIRGLDATLASQIESGAPRRAAAAVEKRM
jgi:hypothetical protein